MVSQLRQLGRDITAVEQEMKDGVNEDEPFKRDFDTPGYALSSCARETDHVLSASYGDRIMDNVTSGVGCVDIVDTRLILLTKWEDHHGWPSMGGLRWLRFNENTNGCYEAHVFVARAGRVFINEKAFFTWMNANEC
jgi:hypothetical protein